MQGLIYSANRDIYIAAIPRITWKLCVSKKHHVEVDFCEECGYIPQEPQEKNWTVHQPIWRYLGPCNGSCEEHYVTLPPEAERVLPDKARGEIEVIVPVGTYKLLQVKQRAAFKSTLNHE